MNCTHTSNRFRAVCGALEGRAGAGFAVICMDCGAFQHPYPWPVEPHARPVPWNGTDANLSQLPAGAGYLVLSEPLSWREAHLATFEAEKSAAAARRDGGWWFGHGLGIPPWLESKEEGGALLVRERR